VIDKLSCSHNVSAHVTDDSIKFLFEQLHACIHAKSVLETRQCKATTCTIILTLGKPLIEMKWKCGNGST